MVGRAGHRVCQGRLGKTISSCPDHLETRRFSGAFRPPSDSSVRRRLVFQDRRGRGASLNLRETRNVVCRGHRENFCCSALDCRPAASANLEVLRHHQPDVHPLNPAWGRQTTVGLSTTAIFSVFVIINLVALA